MKFEAEQTDALLELMRWRRDVRHFTKQPVTEDQVAVLRQAMALAPSVGNSRPWRVVRVSSLDVRRQLIADHLQAKDNAGVFYDDATRAKYSALKLAALEEAPLQLAVFTELDPAQGRGLGRQTMPETLNYSTVLAIHGMWLVARSMNLGVGWVSILNPAEVRRHLNVPANWQLTAYLCIGRPKAADDRPELERVGWQDCDEPEWLTR